LVSLAVMVVIGPNLLGAALLVMQALVVALLALGEFKALARGRAEVA
jgi:hypothetical protein